MSYTYICPHVNTCPIYQNWTEKTKDRRIDILTSGFEVYSCIALDAIADYEGGIETNTALNKRISNPILGSLRCGFLETLNKTKEEIK
jgi:hypothetical protein